MRSLDGSGPITNWGLSESTCAVVSSSFISKKSWGGEVKAVAASLLGKLRHLLIPAIIGEVPEDSGMTLYPLWKRGVVRKGGYNGITGGVGGRDPTKLIRFLLPWSRE